MKTINNLIFRLFLLTTGIIIITCKTGFCQSAGWTTNVDTVTTTGYIKMTGILLDTNTDILGINKQGKVAPLTGTAISNIYPFVTLPVPTFCDTAHPLWYKQYVHGAGALVTKQCAWVGVGELGIANFPNAPLSVSNDNSTIQFTVVKPDSTRNVFTIDGSGNTYVSGKVGIGTTPSSYKLDVNGVIRANEVKVCIFGTCDFVFDKNYKLLPLTDLENYLNLNHHLPGIPSAQEMGSGDGVALGKMNSELLQKVEELTLYILQQQKEIEALQATVGKSK